jgi:hypothetical protein
MAIHQRPETVRPAETPTLFIPIAPTTLGQRPGADPIADSAIRTPDAVAPGWMLPRDKAIGKSVAWSLMQPQSVAMRLLPAKIYETLAKYSTDGVPTECGPDWSKEAIEIAQATGPHVSALTPENVVLVWDKVIYQMDASFVKLVSKAELFAGGGLRNIKVSRLAVVPQKNRRGRLILNLSAGMELPPIRKPGSRRKTKRCQPSVNETTQPATDQEAVKRLGNTMAAALLFQLESPCHWEVLWSKIDLTDGFWRMIVEAGQEYNFVYEMPWHPAHPGDWFVVPSALQMGWTNSLAYFCATTEATQQIITRLLALTLIDGKISPHAHENHCTTPQPSLWRSDSEMEIFLRVFVDDFIQALAGPPDQPSRGARNYGCLEQPSTVFTAFSPSHQSRSTRADGIVFQ